MRFSSLPLVLLGLMVVVSTCSAKKHDSRETKSEKSKKLKKSNKGSTVEDSSSTSDSPTIPNKICAAGWPSITGVVTLNQPLILNKPFDCKNQLYKYDKTDTKAFVFALSEGASLTNCFFAQTGASDTIHISGDGEFTLKNLYFLNTGDDGISVKGSADVKIENVSFLQAGNKAVQHDGSGAVSITGGCYQDVHILVKSCGNCVENKNVHSRLITLDHVKVVDVRTVCGINSNKGDKCTITNLVGRPNESPCTSYNGITNPNVQPSQTGKNKQTEHCQF